MALFDSKFVGTDSSMGFVPFSGKNLFREKQYKFSDSNFSRSVFFQWDTIRWEKLNLKRRNVNFSRSLFTCNKLKLSIMLNYRFNLKT